MTAAADLETLARGILPADVFAYYAGGAGDGQTLAEQERAWAGIPIRPRVLNDVSAVSTSVTLLGREVGSPVLVAPTAMHAMAHAGAEVASARGAGAAGCLFVHSMRSSSRLADVAAAAGPFWQQIYVLRDRGISDDIARLAAASGATALMLTVDTPIVAHKAAGLPPSRPSTGIVAALDGRDPADPRLQQAADLTGRDITRLAEASGLPVIAKGVLRGDAALRCVDAGASGVVVSTHGGRQLDGVVTVPRALPEVVRAVGDRAEVYADGGIRTASDVLRALALGARAVMVGRPVIWALAAAGADGVRDLLAGLTADLGEAVALAGCTSCADVGPDLVYQPRELSIR